jgi:homogentisate 1,2-dioxygenase
MTGHGPDAGTFEKASHADVTKVDIVKDTMAFMFETRLVWHPTAHALASAELQDDYYRCWQGLQKHFDPGQP